MKHFGGAGCFNSETTSMERSIQESIGSLTTQEWLNIKEAAYYLRVSIGSLRNMTSNGIIPYCKLGRRNRYRLTDLRALLLAQKRGG